MADLFHLDIPEVRLAPVDYAALLAIADPDAMQHQSGSIFPEAPLRSRAAASIVIADLEEALA